jgi:hypothetical protein
VDSRQKLEMQTEKGTETMKESDANIKIDVVPAARREEAKQSDGILGTDTDAEPQAVDKALEVGEERLLQLFIPVASTRQSFERLAEREEEKFAEPPKETGRAGEPWFP